MLLSSLIFLQNLKNIQFTQCTLNFLLSSLVKSHHEKWNYEYVLCHGTITTVVMSIKTRTKFCLLFCDDDKITLLKKVVFVLI